VVAESGIASRADVERLSPHVDAFLVGSSLMRADNPPMAARELLFGKVKLCGMRRPEDVACAAPATFAGLVFVPGTPRHVTAEQAAPLAGQARRSGMLPVGVFRDAPLRTVSDIAHLLNLHAVQLHGEEDGAYVRKLRRELDGYCEVWTAVAVGDGKTAFRDGDRTLFDSGPGGTGQSFDWDLIRGHARLPKAVLAGGICPANARSAASVGAYAIDVGSATDELPGIKSPARIEVLFDSLRHQSRQEYRLCA
jgi:indole-3-glycerol phosphate synthase/phosphoribosylanthranilate isomerase